MTMMMMKQTEEDTRRSRYRCTERRYCSTPSPERSRDLPSPPPVDSVCKEEGTGWASPMTEGKVLFMYFRFTVDSPFPYCLVRVSLPDLLPETMHLSPVLQFPVGDFPLFLRCVELDSKFYFLGGEVDCPVPNPKYSGYLPPEVYAVDAHTLAAGDPINHPHDVLKPVSSMNSGKPDPYTFAACGKIYVMAGYDAFLGDRYDDYVPFEAYDPKHDRWTILPEPPTYQVLSGHAVVDREAILVTAHSNILLFNVDTLVWKTLSAPLPSPFPFDTKGEVVDGTLYCCCNSYDPPTVLAYRKRDDGLFDHAASLSPDTLNAYERQVVDISHGLVHLGKRTFCHVTAGIAPLHCEPGVKYRPKLGIHLTLLEVGETYKTSPKFGSLHFFRAKLLQHAFLVTPNRKEPLVQDCFLVSSRGTVAAR